MADRPTPLPRDQFLVTQRYRFFNHAGMAPIPRVCNDAVATVTHDFYEHGGVAFTPWEEHGETVRASAARLMGVDVDEVAFVKNTTEGLGFVASGLAWSEGDRVLVANHEFPSTVYPWLSLRDRGVRVDLLEPVGAGGALPLDLFAAALGAVPTRLVCVSWVQFGRGWRTDLAGLATLCHEHGALLCVDVIQGLGLLPCELDAWGVDFAMADAHKWLLGPLGIGVLSVARRNLDLLTPLEPGWASVAHREEWDNLDLVYDDTARRFEGGSTSLSAIAGMGASIDLLLDAGLDAVWAHVDGLCDRLAGGLTDIGASVLTDRSGEGNSGIVTFAVPGQDTDELWEHLDHRGFVCSARAGGVRLSPHGYNTADEIDELVAEVAAHTGR